MHPIFCILFIFYHIISYIVPFQVKAYLVMAIISALFAVAQIGWTLTQISICITDVSFAPCTVKEKNQFDYKIHSYRIQTM